MDKSDSPTVSKMGETEMSSSGLALALAAQATLAASERVVGIGDWNPNGD
jgi:hypothetical protein